ncbi:MULTISPECIES: ABC transporter substrate-binding protein [unclassified Sinorhizobium]|uniref:ABC transporter substrate-binding protein n=1 Tax=unclassified Sinorhizobium TaxID=2613772 RepID=UPI0024C38462|nr:MULTISPECIES: ABC transporter substrate-binding protein [unclassified Sinorhizobium]MDK1373654.1 ABC transporter substrate-binding protein [Sinorhizobium sp. 6-70]MDK1477785.1 ABC transporter substrate-binding protein [Sinorhizobium sp. 6-117]
MLQKYRALIGANALALALAQSAFAAEKAEVLHWWTTEAQSKAVKVFADAFNAAGGEWVDNAIVNGDVAKPTGINRIVGGNPPTVMMMNAGKQFGELADQGLLNNLDDVAAAGDWKKSLPADVLEAVSRDGHIYAVPVNLQTPNWLWYNKALFEKFGVQEPKTWEDFFAAADKFQAGGIIPLAFGAQPWQQHQLFNGVLAGAGGRDLYLSIFRDKNPEATKTPEFKRVAETYAKIRSYTDPGTPNRSFNEAASMLTTGKAAMHIMGDWEKGEFTAAGWVAGEDYGCVLGLGQQNFLMDSNVFIMPKGESEAAAKAQALMAEVMLDKDVQVKFNNLKGSMPVRNDVDTSGLDACSKVGLEVLEDPGKQLAGPDWLAGADMLNSLADVVVEYWATPSETPDEFADKYAAVLSEFQE